MLCGWRLQLRGVRVTGMVVDTFTGLVVGWCCQGVVQVPGLWVWCWRVHARRRREFRHVEISGRLTVLLYPAAASVQTTARSDTWRPVPGSRGV